MNANSGIQQNQAGPHLLTYILHLADNCLILGHRNSEWTGHGPILEQDIAISNIALDLIGQARNFYQYAADYANQHGHSLQSEMPTGRPLTEDDLAYLRDAWDFKNCLLVEQPNGDWAQTILRQFLFSNYQFHLYQQLQHSNDTRLAAIAEKSLKETTYHLKWSRDWVTRLGDGTTESHQRMLDAINELWKYATELLESAPYESALLPGSIAVDVEQLREPFESLINEVFEEAGLPVQKSTSSMAGGKNGLHSEQLGFILAEMQFLQRAYPNATW
jgi:ring-1,2-phenylacetyl-CoA epoxidase subunit PaaC